MVISLRLSQEESLSQDTHGIPENPGFYRYYTGEIEVSIMIIILIYMNEPIS